LRAAVSLFADMLLDPQTEEMKTQFKWITQELGPYRKRIDQRILNVAQEHPALQAVREGRTPLRIN